jgi:hypothetical protein
MGLMCPVPGKQNAPNLAIAVFPSKDPSLWEVRRKQKSRLLLMEILRLIGMARKRIQTAPESVSRSLLSPASHGKTWRTPNSGQM